MEVTLITTSNSSRRTSAMVKVKSHGISILFHLMQRLLSSCIRSRSLIYAPPRSFLISARFNSSSPSKVDLNNKVTNTAGPSKVNDKGTEGPSKVLATELKNKVIDTVERASATVVVAPDQIWSERSKQIMEDMARSPPANAYSG